MTEARCTRCKHDHQTQVLRVLDGLLCPACIASLRRWMRRPRTYLVKRVRDEQLARLQDQHGAITVLRLAKATGRTVQQAKGVLYYLSSTGRVQRIAKGKYVLATVREQAAE